MKYRNIIIALGFLIVVMPALYFPKELRNALFVISGASVIVLSYLSGKEKNKEGGNPQTSISDQ